MTELRMGRSVYLLEKHISRISKFAEENNLNFSKALDHYLQLGIAYHEYLKVQKEDSPKSPPLPEAKPLW